MKLGSLFGPGPKTLAKAPVKNVPQPTAAQKGALAAVIEKPKHNPADPFAFVVWPKAKPQQIKDYKPILTLAELEEYCLRCQDTGLAGFDYETAGDKDHRQPPLDPETEQPLEGKQLDNWLKNVNLDPWKADISTLSISAAEHESRVIPISHKAGKNFEPGLDRDEARQLVMDTVDRLIFRNNKIVKIAVNLGFETKHTAKHGKYILMPVADPLLMWVRCMQVVSPQKIKVPKKPYSGWGLKPTTKAIFGVEQQDFKKVLDKYGVLFFDEIPADTGDGLSYSAEDADYAVQHYLYWNEIAKQIPGYEKWLHEIEMPFQRVIGLMEYWGMRWDTDLADVKKEEAENMQQLAAAEIKQIGKDTFDVDINPGKSGKTGDVKHLLFDLMNLPAAKWGKTGASLDEEALINMAFMLENKLVAIDEEKYLAVELPEGWETMNPDASYGEEGFNGDLTKEQRGAIKIAQRQPHPYKDQGLRLIQLLKDIQKYSTLLSSHILGREKYLNEVSGRIHAGYGVWTETSRANSFNPNGQNVPRVDNDVFGIRNFYTASPGKVLFLIDFSGFELRIMAWRSKDETMIEIFNTGGDMHRKTAATMVKRPEETVTKKERTDAKPANFGIAYGGTEHALQKTFLTDYGVRKTLDECLLMVNAVKETYPGVPAFQREIELEAREKGYVGTAYGYIRLLPGINSPDRYSRGSAGRQAANTPIQGSAADFMKRAQNTVYDQIGEDTAEFNRLLQEGVAQEVALKQLTLVHGHNDMIAQIHDEIIFEMDDNPEAVKKAANAVKAIMERKPLNSFPVPVEAEPSIAYSWGQKKSLEAWLEEQGA
ncbi:bifunctional 3'-5' exonuclease/DNA polymerase [Bacillota bacterium Lsc_1132]